MIATIVIVGAVVYLLGVLVLLGEIRSRVAAIERDVKAIKRRR